MPKIDLHKVPVLTGAGYPAPYAGAVSGRSRKRIGDAAAFPAGAANGHYLVNRSNADVVFLEVGARAATEIAEFTDSVVDMKAVKDDQGWRSLHKDGRPW